MPGEDESSPQNTISKSQKWGKRDNKATAFAADREPCIITASKAQQGWEELQKLLTKLGNQTTMTEKVQCTQMPKQAVSEEIWQAACSAVEAGLRGSAVGTGNHCSSTACKRPASWISMKNMLLYNLVTHHSPCLPAHFEAGPKETLLDGS